MGGLGGSPETYHLASLRWGTATSSSTRTGTTSARPVNKVGWVAGGGARGVECAASSGEQLLPRARRIRARPHQRTVTSHATGVRACEDTLELNVGNRDDLRERHPED